MGIATSGGRGCTRLEGEKSTVDLPLDVAERNLELRPVRCDIFLILGLSLRLIYPGRVSYNTKQVPARLEPYSRAS